MEKTKVKTLMARDREFKLNDELLCVGNTDLFGTDGYRELLTDVVGSYVGIEEETDFDYLSDFRTAVNTLCDGYNTEYMTIDLYYVERLMLK